jgi:cytochrome P450
MVVETILQYALSPYILVTTLVVLVITYLWYSYGVKPYSFFKDRGIDGPPPKAFVGSLGDLAKYQDRPLDSYADFLKKYGQTYGIFMGWTPFLVTVDPEMIKQIFVRNFDKFPQRMGRRGIFSPKYEGKVHDQLTTAKGEDWRRRRRILSPAFSGLKMRMYRWNL